MNGFQRSTVIMRVKVIMATTFKTNADAGPTGKLLRSGGEVNASLMHCV